MIYLIAVILGVLAVGFACWPLVRGRKTAAQVHHEDVVRAVYRQRISELAGETIDENLRSEIEQELGAVLLSETQKSQESAATTNARAPFWLLGLFLPIAAISLYFNVADPNLANIRGAEEVLQLSNDDDVALKSWQLRLDARTQSAPEDSKSWYLLGHVYLKLGEFSQAAEAFATTHQLVGDDLNIQVYWLQSRYLAANGMLDDVSENLAQKILEQQPNLPVVLEILALDAFRRGEGEAAIRLLNRGMSGASDLRQQASFASAIRQVRESLQTPPPGINVAVSAQQKVPAHGTVFVIARPIGGGMPFAVVKRPGFLLPFEVQLDDLVTMSPERKLSDAPEFEVLVRMSASGNAMASDGDWQWQSQPLAQGDLGSQRLDAILTPPE